MEDLYSYLIGPTATEPQKQRAVVDQLRRRRSYGELGALTGDRVLQPFGTSMVKAADEDATQLQAIRQKDIDNAQTEKYQTGQLNHMKAAEDLMRRGQNLDHVYQMMMAEAAQTKADKAGAQKIPKLRQGDIKDLQDMAQDIGEFNALEDYLKSGKGFGAVTILGHKDPKTGVEKGGIPIPGLRWLKNTGAGLGIGTDEDKEAFAMKQRFDRLYTLGARNRLFGATLTANEQRAWQNANPSTRQTDEQLVEALPVLRKIFEKRLGNKARGLARENYDPDAISEYADLSNIDLSGQGGHGPVQQKRVKVDVQGNIIGD